MRTRRAARIGRRLVMGAVATTALLDGFPGHADAATFLATWSNGASGNYNQGAVWSTLVAPNDGGTSFYNVVINRPGGAVVNGNLTAEVLNFTLGAGNEIDFNPGIQYTLIGQAGGGTSTLSNAGTLALNGSTLSTNTKLLFNGIDASITGSGTIFTSNQSIIGGVIGHLTTSNSIIGGGLISVNQLNNNGTISANDSSLTINASSGVVNNGLITVTTPTGNLILSNSLFTNNGSITATGGGIVNLSGATISGGMISADATSQFRVGTLNAATIGNLTSNTDIRVFNGSTLGLIGTIVNNGSIGYFGNTGSSTYNLGASTVTLNGTGTLQLGTTDVPVSTVTGTGTLVNNSNILGHGTIALNNVRNTGLIQTLSGGGSLSIAGSLFSPMLVTNTGTIQATASTMNVGFGTWDNTGGTLQVDNPATMTFGTGVSFITLAISGGSLNVATGGVAQTVTGSGAATFSGMSITNNGTLQTQSNTTLNIVNSTITSSNRINVASSTIDLMNVTLNNTGDIIVASSGTLLIDGGTTTISGTGRLQLSGTTALLGGSGTLVNNSLIFNFGKVGNNTLAIINTGTILANSTSGPIDLDPGAGGLSNSGTIEAVTNVRMFDGTYTNTGIIRIDSTGSLQFGNGANIVGGGTISEGTIPGGQVNVDPAASALISNQTIRPLSINVVGSSTLTLSGTIINNGSINVTANATAATLLIGPGSVTLNGSGTTTLAALTSVAAALIDGSNATLNIGTQQTVHGQGTIGLGALAIVNAGTINADVNFQRLTINVGSTGFTNNNTLTSSGTGVLALNGVGGGVIDNSNGTIESQGTRDVQLSNGITINGGTLNLSTLSNGVTINISTASLIGVTNRGNISLGTGSLNLGGIITNRGAIFVGNNPSAATLSIGAGSVLLTGIGSVQLTTALTSISGSGGTLSNGSQQRIFGTGTVGNDSIAVLNSGTIVAGGAQTLTLNPSGGNLVNTGTLAANSGATLAIINNFSIGTFTSTGTILATTGGTVSISGTGAFESTGTVIVQNGGTLINSMNLTATKIQLDGQFNNLFRVRNPNSASLTISGAGTFSNGDASHVDAMASIHTLRVGAFNANTGTTSIRVGGGTVGTGRANAISFGANAQLDLEDHDFIVDYTGTSPLSTVASLITSGFANGAWNGPGINSFQVAGLNAIPGSHKVGLGYADASAVGSPGTFSGQSIDNTAVLIRYTYLGDANVDGKVNALDFNAVATNFGGALELWQQGDFNYDGTVNTADFTALGANFNINIPLAPALGSIIPEPLLFFVPVALMASARRRRT